MQPSICKLPGAEWMNPYPHTDYHRLCRFLFFHRCFQFPSRQCFLRAGHAKVQESIIRPDDISAPSTFSRCVALGWAPFPSSFVLGQPKAVGTSPVWGRCFCGAFLTLSSVITPDQCLQLYLQTHSQKPVWVQSANQSPSVARSHRKTNYPMWHTTCVLLDFCMGIAASHGIPLGCHHCPSLPESPSKVLLPSGCSYRIPDPVGDDNTHSVKMVLIWTVPN